MVVESETMKWRYERGEGRRKHCWSKPFAGFVPSRRGEVGKCSSEITDEVAQTLLDTGIELFEFEEDSYPSRIYNVFHGVIYEAMPTIPGRSYHGFPWRGQRLPLIVVVTLEQKAKASGYEAEFNRWLKTNTK